MTRGFIVRTLGAALAAFLLTAVSTVHAQHDLDPKLTGVLVVSVVNGTPDGHSPVGDSVTVKIIRHEELFDTLQGTVGDDGKAVFTAVPLGEHLIATLVCRHEQVVFGGRNIALTPSQTHLTTQVRVYDVSTDNSTLLVTSHHISIKRIEGGIDVFEYMRLKNPTHRAITADTDSAGNKTPVMRIILPRGYRDFTSQSYFITHALTFTEQGFTDSMAVAPGEYDLKISYTLDVTTEQMEFVKQFSFPTDSIVLLAALPDAEVKGLGSATDFVMSDGQAGKYYSLGPYGSGDELKFQLSGFVLPKADRSWIIIAVVFSHIAMLVIWRMRRQNKAKSQLLR